jgi:sigma-B regulation protein RsbU (phosphoserine phosphatase)
VIGLKGLYRRMEQVAGSGTRRVSPRALASRWLPQLLEDLGPSFATTGAQLYSARDGCMVLEGSWGNERPAIGAELSDRLCVRGFEFPWTGPTAAGWTTLIEMDEGAGLVAALFHDDQVPARADPHRDAVLSSLQYALAQHRRRHELEDLVEQARAIQTSLLPAGPILFDGFDIAAISVPARHVGGDVYDFVPLDSETLAITVADAAGHGLPAALQARDVITGLRMGVERDLKITRTVEKLNRIIHRSGLVTRFVSLVFGELETNGNLAYINAGHPPPLLLDDHGTHELGVGGIVLGPDASATYKLGFAHVDRGASLILVTDGVLEHRRPGGTMFGVEGVRHWLEDWRCGPAESGLADLMERLRAFGGRRFEDDVSAVFIRRPA